jgi:hypothetical protein
MHHHPLQNSTSPHTTRAFTILKNTAALAMSFARFASGWRSIEVWSTADSSAELRSSTISTIIILVIIKAFPRVLAGSSNATGIAIAAINISCRNASSCCQAARKPCHAIPVARQAWVKPGRCLLCSSTSNLQLQESAYDSIGGQAQTRCLSPYTLSTLATLGQNLLSRTEGKGKAAFSRE